MSDEISEKWAWMAAWCKRNGVSPWDNAVWEEAAKAWAKHIKEQAK